MHHGFHETGVTRFTVGCMLVTPDSPKYLMVYPPGISIAPPVIPKEPFVPCNPITLPFGSREMHTAGPSPELIVAGLTKGHHGPTVAGRLRLDGDVVDDSRAVVDGDPQELSCSILTRT